MRGDLFSRLLLLVVAATAPAILVLIYLQADIHRDQREKLSADALVQAELVNSDLTSIIEGARQLTLAISEFPTVGAFSPDCRGPLTNLARTLSKYDLFNVVNEKGDVICSSDQNHGRVMANQQREQVPAANSGDAFFVGAFLPADGVAGPVLMLSQPFTGADGRRGVVNAGLSIKWLNEHFEHFKRPPGSTIGISDRNGTTLVRVPNVMGAIGKPLPAAALALVSQPEPGNAVISGADGRDRLVGFLPATTSPTSLFSSVGLFLPDLLAAIDRTTSRAYGLIAISTIVSLGLAMLLGLRFVRRPTAALLAAARAWTSGDLAARVMVNAADRSEFGRISQAFNTMAAGMQYQREESQDLRMTLEARVTERTADLRDSRDRLQVAMGEHANAEASLRQAQKLQVVGQLAGGIAHDFNNLLTAVIGALEMLRRRIAEPDARSLRLLDSALQAADRGGRLTSQLLSFSRRQRLLPVATDLNALVNGMLSLLHTTLGRDITVQTNLGPTVWPALVDPNQVESAILNLALNARDAMEGRGTLSIATSNVTLDPDQNAPPTLAAPNAFAVPAAPNAGDYIQIRVCDTGTGMPPEVLARVFEPFFTTKPSGRGSGLGLSQVHGLAAQSGGELRVESELGAGTVVSLLLPRASETARGASSNDTPLSIHKAPQRILRVLVVDDDADVRDLTAEMLRELGHAPLVAADSEAVHALLERDGPVDVLLADYSMPRITGAALIDQIRKTWPDMPAMLVTGHADADAPGLMRGHPVLRKPFTLAVLAGAIDRLMLKPQEMSAAAED